VVCSCICNYDFDECQFEWKWRWKVDLYHLLLKTYQNKWKCSCLCDLGCGSKATRHYVTSYSISIVTINPSYKYTCN
jgi:hypothetical protein